MKKAYVSPCTELVLLSDKDILVTSLGDDIGLGGPAAKDQEWDLE